jgi:hypothetical protein
MSPLAHPYAGNVRREPAILDHQPIGPWRGRVRITPLLGVRDTTTFEVRAEWEAGPPLLCMGEHWTGEPRQAAADIAHVDDVELARAVALEAEDLLRDGVRFDLQQLAHERAARR